MFGIMIGVGTKWATTETFLVYNAPITHQEFRFFSVNFDNEYAIQDSREWPFHDYDDEESSIPW